MSYVPNKPWSTRLVERIPQTICLHSGLEVHLRNHADIVGFWGAFSSPDYLALAHDLRDVDLSGGRIVDCGAGIGMFALLMEHFRRVGLVAPEALEVECIEPAAYNVPQLRKNLAANLDADAFAVRQAVVGRREGEATFFESPKRPWSGSLLERTDTTSRPVTRPYLDLEPLLTDQPCLLKVDIEGGEFELIEAYGDVLGRVRALIIEWHTELGDVPRAEGQLRDAGLRHARRSTEDGRRIVDLYLPA